MAMFEQLSRALDKGMEALSEAVTTLRLAREVLATLPALVSQVQSLTATAQALLESLLERERRAD